MASTKVVSTVGVPTSLPVKETKDDELYDFRVAKKVPPKP
jgi:hypothetical protein